MANSMLIQQQIKDNTEDLHNFVRDLKHWEEEMKRKDRQLSNDQNEEILPPVRRAKCAKKTQSAITKEKKGESKNGRIRSYEAWDKFDVEKACEEVDNETGENNSDEDDDEAAKQDDKYLREKALYEKELGNNYVKACKWDEAIESYTRAISSYPKDPIFFANRALCYLKKYKYYEVESDCTESLKIDPTYVKALLRRAAAREALDRLEDARHDLRQALQLEPNNTQAQRDLHRLKNSTGKKKSSEKDIVKPNLTTEKDHVKTLTMPKIESTPSHSVKKEPSKQSLSEAECSKNGKNKQGHSTEPCWEPGKSTIDPVSKPPHLRSQKSLKRIDIYDIGPNLPEHKCKIKLPKQVVCEAVSKSQSKIEVQEEIPSASGVKPRSIFTVNIPLSLDIPPPPKTSVQFHKSWNSIKTDTSLCYKFLKQIPGMEMPDIFKESLESRIFSNIVHILATEFVTADDPVLPYLRGLSAVRRFSTIALFMTPADKSNLTKLFDHSINKGECSHEDIISLRRLYEMT